MWIQNTGLTLEQGFSFLLVLKVQLENFDKFGFLRYHVVRLCREVLKECPLAIEAIRCLLQLGVKLKEIQVQ